MREEEGKEQSEAKAVFACTKYIAEYVCLLVSLAEATELDMTDNKCTSKYRGVDTHGSGGGVPTYCLFSRRPLNKCGVNKMNDSLFMLTFLKKSCTCEKLPLFSTQTI